MPPTGRSAGSSTRKMNCAEPVALVPANVDLYKEPKTYKRRLFDAGSRACWFGYRAAFAPRVTVRTRGVRF